MTTKQFIGSGRKHPEFDSVTVTLRMDEALKHTFKSEHGTFLTFILSTRQQPDNYGKTHSAFVIPKKDQAELPLKQEPSVEASKTTRRKKGNVSQKA